VTDTYLYEIDKRFVPLLALFVTGGVGLWAGRSDAQGQCQWHYRGTLPIALSRRRHSRRRDFTPTAIVSICRAGRARFRRPAPGPAFSGRRAGSTTQDTLCSDRASNVRA
jgi:hypothetical protein